jgi:hypothetical protein
MAETHARFPEAEKNGSSHHEDVKHDSAHNIAERGHAATDV